MFPMPDFVFHRATESDRTYLQRLNYLADVFGDEGAELDQASRDGVAPYIDDWDPERDSGVVAFDEFRTPAGGVWLRYWRSPEEGHAFLGTDVPEIAIAVENRFAGHGLGTLLLDEAVNLAREQGARRIALWVDPDNARARHRYESYGFQDAEGGADTAQGADTANVMVFDL